MVAALRLHWLRDGELPLYTLARPEFFWLNVNEADPPASGWESRRTYRAGKAILPNNVDLIQDDQPTIRYCIVMTKDVPIYDLMLGQKILLEKDPETFFRIANARSLVENIRAV